MRGKLLARTVSCWQVWELRTQEDHDKLRAQCHGLGKGAREKLLTSHGYNTLDHAFVDVPGVEVVHCPMDLMHVEFEGNVKVHIAALIYMMVRVLRWTTLDRINSAIQAANSSGYEKTPEFRANIIEGTEHGMPKADTAVPWTAMQTLHFATRALHVLAPIVPA